MHDQRDPSARTRRAPARAAASSVPSGRSARAARVCLPVLLWAVALSGCAPAAARPAWQPGTAQPLIVGWQQYFAVQWGATPQNGSVLIEGYVTNTWGFPVRDVRVLVSGFDAAGTQTGQLLAWGPNLISPGDRVYFDVTVPAGSATYDVSVYSWKWTWPPSGGT